MHETSLRSFDVDPLQGCHGEGHIFPGAWFPWGMASFCPHTDTCYGGYAEGAFYHAFGHTHLSGVGGSAQGAVPVMVAPGHLPPRREAFRAKSAAEYSVPGYYRVAFPDRGLSVEATVTPRGGLSLFRLEGGGAATLSLALADNLGPIKGGLLRACDDGSLEGWQDDGDFCGTGLGYRVYFVLRARGAKGRWRLWMDGEATAETRVEGRHAAATFWYEAKAGEALVVQVGLSYTGVEQARDNLGAEQAAIGFDEAVGRVQSAWAEVLSRAETEGGAAGDRTRFASALYRACLHPSLYSDADGSYRDAKGQVRRVRDGRPRHTVFSLWDTYRTVFPLYALLWPERLSNLVGNLLDLQAESGWLPKWELGGTETFIMPGDPALMVLADALAREVPGLDQGRIREAVLHQVDAMDASGHSDVRPGLGAYLRYGYLPDDLDVPARPIWTTTMKGSVSHTLEYAYADWSAARILERLGEDGHARRLDARGASWRNLLHPGTCFFRPRNADGAWVEPFDPRSRSGGTWDSRSARGFVEGHAWHYRFAVPHAIPELMALHGGPDPFAAALRQLFDEDLYDGTNEPDMAYPFLFNQIPGHAERTGPMVHHCLRRFWRDGRDGLPGDDDCGTLSTWLLFAMMGFYPDCPGLPRSQLFAPAFDRVLLRLPEGKTWEIEARRARPGALGLRALHVNGQPHPSLTLAHATQARGGTIRYDLD